MNNWTFSESDLEICSNPNATVTCDENWNYRDCGQLRDSKFRNFGCQHSESEIFDFFECSNRKDKKEILFKQPPVPRDTAYEPVNYNQVLNFTDVVIHCGDFDIPWPALKEMAERDSYKKCLLTSGRNTSLLILWQDLKVDFSFKMSPLLTEL